jgi:uncharacterized protein YeaO (DUF488 family)
MAVREKSIYQEAAPDDGVRILTTNYWPRGISRERAGSYKRILGPSRELLRGFKDGDIDWPEYERRYLAEMEGEAQQREIDGLAQLARTDTVTVMCVCKADDQCHRRLLKRLIEQRMEQP